jgi:somatostatin receptor 2
LIVWISQTFNLQLGSLSGSCKVIIFLSYICGFISVWLVVFVTLENYIRICKPFVVKRFCTTTLAKFIVAILCLISVCLYNFPFWAMSEDNCLYLPRHRNSVQALIYTDTVITLALPICCIIYLMTAIVCNLVKSFRVRKLRRASRTSTNNPLAKVTKMLFAVTVTFFCLNLPSHIYRYVKMISSFVYKSSEPDRHSIKEEAIQQTTLLMSYISISTNIIVYIIFGSKFRAVFLQMCHLCGGSTTENDSHHAQRKSPVGSKQDSSYHSKNINFPANRSLTVLTDNECSSELMPLQRAYTK